MGKIKTFLTGGMIGAVLGVLFAPKKGEETRKELSGETDKWSGKAKEAAETVKKTAEDLKAKAKDMFKGSNG
jgi:gas vesicle protein